MWHISSLIRHAIPTNLPCKISEVSGVDTQQMIFLHWCITGEGRWKNSKSNFGLEFGNWNDAGDDDS